MDDNARNLSASIDGVVGRFRALIEQTAARHGLSAPECDEAVQDVRIRLWKALSTGQNIESAPASYVYRATISAVIDYIRRRRARREDELDTLPAAETPAARHGDEADTTVGESDVAGAVDRVLASLPEVRQAVLRLHLAGYDRLEIARLLGWTEPKTRNHLYRGLATIREELARMGFGPGRQT
jgi:RNA polymerase sigma factor (sigma-70 family)